MQERKIDTNQIIGFVLMMAIMLGFMWWMQPSEEEVKATEKEKQAQIEKAKEEEQKQAETVEVTPQVLNDSLSIDTSVEQQEYALENDKLLLKFSNVGGQITLAQLKEYQAYSDSAQNHEGPLQLIANGNANFGLTFKDKQGREVDLSKRSFVAKQNGNSIVFTTQVEGGKVDYIYTLKDGYDLDMQLKTQGMPQFASTDAQLKFDLKALSQEKGKSWEQRTTELYYSMNDHSDIDYSTKEFTADPDENLDWIAFKQQFFATVLKSENKMVGAKATVAPIENDSIYSKYFTYETPLASGSKSDLNENYTWHFFPLEYNLLRDYEEEYEDVIPFGWGLFGWINEWIILPVFRFMAGWGLQYGWVIALLTIFIKLITSPIMYRQYRQSAMMRALKPDLEVINEKHKGQENAMKRQQATMEVYRKAGVNQLAGCLPGLLQIPIFYALFNFFPNIIDLRGKGFLWAEDLTAYDSIIDLPFNIPFYGDHVSLLALLYVVAMVIYMRMSGTNMAAPTQEGMPDMKKLMYIMPVMFIFFLNSYASGLSWYYFVSNTINIGLIFVIKNWMIDDEKIHEKIQENKKKEPKKKSKWREKLDEAMKAAQEQQGQQKKKK